MLHLARLTVAFIASALLVAAGCRDSTDPTDPPDDRIFRVTEGGAESLDPNLIAEGAGTRIAEQMFEPLVSVAQGNGPPVAGGATSWEVSEDGKVYTFHLRKGNVWSDGTPITSADYLFSWERALNPKTKSRNAQHYWIIKGAKAYNSGDTKDFSTVGVKAVDDFTLRVELKGPAPYFLDLLTYVIFSPVPRHVIARHGDQWTRPENIEVNGPFKMTEWKLRERVAMKKNPRYWGARAVWLNGVTFFDTESENTAFSWYERGKVHWIPAVVPINKIPTLLRNARTDFHIDPILCIYYYVFNTKKPPFDDVRVRRAFNMAVDKARLTRQILGAGQKPASHLVPELFKELRSYPGERGDPYDPQRARQQLAEAGYGPGGKPFPPVTLLYNTYEAHRIMAEFAQRSIGQNLGVSIEIHNMEWKTLLPTMHAGDFQIARAGWCADFPDPQDFLQVFHSDGENNYGKWKSPAFDEVVETLSRTASQSRRNELTARAEAILNREVPVLPIYFYTRSYMLRNFVKGFVPQIQDRHLLKRVWFEGGE